jgi:hypothetical protein
LRDGRWGAVEVKLGNKQIEEAVANLLRFQEKINTDRMNKASFLMVLTGGQFAYQRPEGVWIVPIHGHSIHVSKIFMKRVLIFWH